MISESLSFDKSQIQQPRARTPSLKVAHTIVRNSFPHQSKDIRFPSVRLEGEIFQTCVTEPIEKVPILFKEKKPTKRITKIAKPIPTVNILNCFNNNLKKKSRGFSEAKGRSNRNLSLDSTKFCNNPKFRTANKDSGYNPELFKIFTLTPKKVIANLQSCQQYVRKTFC